jgi:hypothetical protein
MVKCTWGSNLQVFAGCTRLPLIKDLGLEIYSLR